MNFNPIKLALFAISGTVIGIFLGFLALGFFSPSVKVPVTPQQTFIQNLDKKIDNQLENQPDLGGLVEATTTEQIRNQINTLIEKHDVLHPRKIDFIGVYNLSSGKKIISYYFEDEEATEIEYKVKE